MSDSEDSFAMSRRLQRTASEDSFAGDGDNTMESQNLLAGDAERAAPPVPEEAQQTSTILRALKRGMDTLVSDAKKQREQIVIIDKKLNTVIHKNDALEKLMKEMVARNNKGVEDLDTLLTAEGLKRLKLMCFKNLDFKAKSQDELDLLERFMKMAKDEAWLLNPANKAKEDIFKQFRDKRNYLKAQVRSRVHEDMANKTDEHASKLPKSEKFIREHLGVSELSEECLKVLFTFAYVHLKYLNKEANLNTAEKKVAKKVKDDPWGQTMMRVESDRIADRDHSVIKDRFIVLLGERNFIPA